MKSAEVFDYLVVAVSALQSSRQHFARGVDDRRRHEREGSEVIAAVRSVREMLDDGAYPQLCLLCGDVIQCEADTDWHGLGTCVEICTRCGGSGEEPKEKS